MAATSSAKQIASRSPASSSAGLRWAASGWAFFIAENTILSENRNYLIDALGGDDQYHLVYGACSTAATASIAYAYYKLTRIAPADLYATRSNATALIKPLPLRNLVVSWSLLSLGLVMASQALPKMQFPVTIASEAAPKEAPSSSGGIQMKVRCPFDFSDKHAADNEKVQGLDRISRHAGLWSLGLVGLGQACLQTSPSLALWWTGPAFVAWLGGMHQDSRFRRRMGGTLDPMYESQTSQLPFAALLTGKQGAVGRNMGDLLSELKLLNAIVAVAGATVWIASRGRLRIA